MAVKSRSDRKILLKAVAEILACQQMTALQMQYWVNESSNTEHVVTLTVVSSDQKHEDAEQIVTRL
jgi:hypothetical protein